MAAPHAAASAADLTLDTKGGVHGLLDVVTVNRRSGQDDLHEQHVSGLTQDHCGWRFVSNDLDTVADITRYQSISFQEASIAAAP